MDDRGIIKALRGLTSNAKYKKVFRYLSARKLSSRSTDAYSMEVDVHAHYIKELFQELNALGLGQISSNGRSIKWGYDPISIGLIAMGKEGELKKFESSNAKTPIPNLNLEDCSLDSILQELHRRGYRVSLEPLSK